MVAAKHRCTSYIQVIDGIYSLVSCVLFVYGTYLYSTPMWLLMLEVHFAIFFAYGFFWGWYCSPRRSKYLYTPDAFVDVVTIVPTLLGAIGGGGGGSVGFVRAFRILKMTKVMKVLKGTRLLRLFSAIDNLAVVRNPIDDAVSQQSMTLVASLVAFVVICAGIVQFMAERFEDADMWCVESAGSLPPPRRQRRRRRRCRCRPHPTQP